MDDLVERNDLYYEKFTNVPFNGKVTGREQGSFKNGVEDGAWVEYWDNGQLSDEGNYKKGKKDGSWVTYYPNGQLWVKGNYKNGKKEGAWFFYEPNGTLMELHTGTYKDGWMISN